MIATPARLDGRLPMPRAFIEPLRAGAAALIALVKLGIDLRRRDLR